MRSAPTATQLESAREEFRSLLTANAVEFDFQRLFTRCPFILSRTIPLRVEPHEIHALARPGISEPDFIFYPQPPAPLSTFGVVELKRPSTRLVTIPRKQHVILSRDAATAISQGQRYAVELGRKLTAATSRTILLGTRSTVFVIAGLTTELLKIVKPEEVTATLDGLIPAGCQIIPYDTILEMFSSTLPRRILMLRPAYEYSLVDEPASLVARLEQPSWRMTINDENFEFWSSIETAWRDGRYIGTRRSYQLFSREEWSISGTNILATESPAHLDFPATVRTLISAIRRSADLEKQFAIANSTGPDLTRLDAILKPNQLEVLRRAVQECRRWNRGWTDFDPFSPETDLFENLGLIQFSTYESAEFSFILNPMLIEILS